MLHRYKSIFLTVLLFTALILIGCQDEDSMTEPEPEPTGMLSVSDQVLSQNMINVSNVNLDKDGWIVIHRDNGGNAPMVPDIISEPVLVKAGSQSNVKVPFKNDVTLNNQEVVWVMLHTDNGTMGTYEFDGQSEFDAPITQDGDIVMKSVTINSASIDVSNQPVVNNTVTIASVESAVDGWIVIHNDDGSGNITLPDIIGKTQVNAGINTDVKVELDNSINYTAGQKLFPMLHIDDVNKGSYDFPDNGDGPEIFGNEEFPNNVIFTSFAVSEPTGELTVSDQTISQNMINVSSVDMSGDGWIVIHRDNNGAPVVPDIISEPEFVNAGNSNDVHVKFKEDVTLTDGEKVWVMLHTDNGTMEKYEFDGSSGIDNPILQDGAPVMTQITINSASITVSDQSVENNTITIENVNAAVDGWIVVHNDDGSGNITLPGIIGKTKVSAGMNSMVEIELDNTIEYQSGQKLFPMLHIDNANIGEYDFPDNGDGPEIFGNEEFPNNVIFTSFNVQ